MRLYALAILSALHISAIYAAGVNPKHRHLKRQHTPAVAAPKITPSPPPPPSANMSQTIPSPPSPPTISVPSVSTSLPSSSLPTLVSATATPTGPPPLDTGTGVPPLANITAGMPTQAPLPVSTTYLPGATPPVSGAPVLPSALVLGSWPALDKLPDTSSPEVQNWLTELDGFNIPDIPPSIGGSCATDPAAAADAASRGWWTCGGYTRGTDIVACPDQLTWGVSFDDGPSFYTQKLLNYLDIINITATFFVVGSRAIELPQVLIEEYMSGHEISIHTWSHPYLTTLTNEQIVAELGWTRKAIKDVLGVTPTTMRPPYGDIDDRVRAICLAMGLVPIIWSETPSGAKFDTNDWRVAAGTIAGNQSIASFQQILNNATTLDTGFIVLQHDLYEITVDLAVGYTLNIAQNFQPKLDLKPIGECSGFPPGNLYRESNTNTSFPYSNQTMETGTGGGDGVDIDGNGTSSDVGSTSTNPNTGAGFITAIPVLCSLTFGATIAALSVTLF